MLTVRPLSAAGLLLAVTALKLASPQTAALAQGAVAEALNLDYSYIAALSLPQESEERRYDAVSLRSAEAVYSDSYMTEAMLTEAERLAAAEKEAAVAAFWNSQTEFAELTLPSGVSLDFPTLPFDSASPLPEAERSGFGYRLHPVLGVVRFHYGTDFAADEGDSVAAFAGGTVSECGWDDSYGYYIVISHADGWQTLYAHCSALCVSTGEEVALGQEIARVGSTGLATGPHLHFELMREGLHFDPEFYV
ncbi:MAG: M23 family metallopeptidase [Oscillospiraceae bacterium]|nr:M23 family metallopeptidase [Oscillospiraceae bacterium]